jgi:hypothetical protein
MAISKNPKSFRVTELIVSLLLMSVFVIGWFYFNRSELVFERLMKDTHSDIDVVRFLHDSLSLGDVDVLNHNGSTRNNTISPYMFSTLVVTGLLLGFGLLWYRVNAMERKSCSFCGKAKSEVSLLIEKPGCLICDECVVRLTPLLENSETSVETELYEKCSFCSFMRNLPFFPVHPENGRRVVGGPQYWICDACLDLCQEIIAEHKK